MATPSIEDATATLFTTLGICFVVCVVLLALWHTQVSLFDRRELIHFATGVLCIKNGGVQPHSAEADALACAPAAAPEATPPLPPEPAPELAPQQQGTATPLTAAGPSPSRAAGPSPPRAAVATSPEHTHLSPIRNLEQELRDWPTFSEATEEQPPAAGPSSTDQSGAAEPLASSAPFAPALKRLGLKSSSRNKRRHSCSPVRETHVGLTLE